MVELIPFLIPTMDIQTCGSESGIDFKKMLNFSDYFFLICPEE